MNNAQFFDAIPNDDPWKVKFLELRAWIKEHERMPTRKYPGPVLWFYQNNRALMKWGKLDDNKDRLLRALGITPPDQFARQNRWNKLWYDMFFRYMWWREYSEVSYMELEKIDSTLYHWIRNTRRFYTSKKQINAVKIALLDKVEFGKSRPKYSFDTQVECLLLYKERFGTTHVRQSRGPYYGLSRWVNTIRTMRKRGQLPQEQIDKLDAIDFIWDMEVWKFQQYVNKLAKYFNKHGHFNVSSNTDPELSAWVASQRCRPPALSKHRRLLNAIGFQWKAPKEKSKFE